MKLLIDITGLFADIFTIGASGIAIYLFAFKRNAIASVFSLLLNYSYQLSLTELKEKLDRINEYSAADDDENVVIMNILHEFLGQVRGNDKLKLIMAEQIVLIEGVITKSDKGKKITEQIKRSLVSEVREKIRHLNIQVIDEIVGGRK
ncbi:MULTISPECIES: hypothetical protein [Pseudomonas]|uniref:hypothetical protein n=1 Tax=Pseudomonas TaxID=286 RepID=UPI001D0CB3E2|nr:MULTISPECIES: hypothetical protein [Pseudomonas]